MPDIRLILWVLLVAILGASADARGWSEPRVDQTGWQIATPPSAIPVRTADSQTAPDPAAPNDGDEVPDITQRPAASTEGDKAPTAPAPGNPEPSAASPQSATSSPADEVPSPIAVPDGGGALTSKPSAGAAPPRRPPLRLLAPRSPSLPTAMLGSRISCATRSKATPQRSRCNRSIRPAATRRCGAPMAKSMTAGGRRWLILPVSAPTVSIQPTIRCRISRLYPIRRRWPTRRSN